jgi:hypothetical protein
MLLDRTLQNEVVLKQSQINRHGRPSELRAETLGSLLSTVGAPTDARAQHRTTQQVRRARVTNGVARTVPEATPTHRRFENGRALRGRHAVPLARCHGELGSESSESIG